MRQCFFLSGDDTIRTVQKSLDFFLISVLNCCMHRAIFFIFTVEMEDDLS